MYPFRRILIPTDFSTASQWAFHDAARIAAENGAEIVVLHIRMTWESQPDALRFPADASLYEYAEKQELERIRAQLGAASANINTRLIVKNAPDAGAEICRTAKAEKVDLIIVATHARHHVAHLLIGSTTMSIINDPPAPVLAIRYGIKKRTGMKRILVPIHLKQKSRAALELALEVAGSQGGEIHLLTICPDEERAAAEALLDQIAQQSQGVKLTNCVVRGTDVDREIIRYTAKVDPDVIFLNAEKEIRKTKIDILRHASTPMMIVPSAN